MLWILAGISGAFFKSLTGLFRKQITHNVSASVFAWLNASIATVLLLPLTMYLDADLLLIFRDDLGIIVGAAVFSVLGVLLNVMALEREELSFVAPLNGLIPFFTLLGGLFILAEAPPVSGFIGLGVIIIGTYIMAIQPSKVRWFDPLVHLLKSPAAWLSVGVAASYAINTVFLKSATNAGYGVVTVLFATNLLAAVLMSYVLVTKQRRQIISSVQQSGRQVLGSTISSVLSGLLHLVAVSLTYSSYAVALRRFDSLFGVLLGWKVLNESNIRNKLTGAAIITLGTIILALGAS